MLRYRIMQHNINILFKNELFVLHKALFTLFSYFVGDKSYTQIHPTCWPTTIFIANMLPTQRCIG